MTDNWELKEGNLAGLSREMLQRIAWSMELGDRVLAQMAAEHVHGVEAIVRRGGAGR